MALILLRIEMQGNLHKKILQASSVPPGKTVTHNKVTKKFILPIHLKESTEPPPKELTFIAKENLYGFQMDNNDKKLSSTYPMKPTTKENHQLLNHYNKNRLRSEYVASSWIVSSCQSPVRAEYGKEKQKHWGNPAVPYNFTNSPHGQSVNRSMSPNYKNMNRKVIFPLKSKNRKNHELRGYHIQGPQFPNLLAP